MLSRQSTLQDYYRLTKPGIIYGNILTTVAGFIFACHWHIVLRLFVATIVGTGLIIAAACVCNNYLDREIDKKMARTKSRALVAGRIPARNALLYGSSLLLAGIVLLLIGSNRLVLGLGLIGFVDYVALYGWVKRRSPFGTLVGSISGSMPIVAGYCAVTDRFNGGAVLLFLILTAWQMAHFYGIALYRLQDYKAAGIPVLPAVRGGLVTKQRVLGWIVGFWLVNIVLAADGYAGLTYVVIMSLLSFIWLWKGVNSWELTAARWGRQMFLFSLIVICGLSLALVINPLAS